MPPRDDRLPVDLFCTAPQSTDFESGDDFRAEVRSVSRWCEEAGYRGILIYTSNRFVDPWMVAIEMIEATERLCPFIAVQPVFMHPYWVAKKVASIGYGYRRRLWLNMVAGGFKNELIALGDDTPHDRRYDRLTEYTRVIMGLLTERQVEFSGEFYRIDKLALQPRLAAELAPQLCVSGSSPAGMEAARALGAIAIEVPKPGDEYLTPEELRTNAGIRIGIVADERNDRAWQIARERFPEDRKGQIVQQMANKASDGKWYNQLSASDLTEFPDSPYWLGPFKNFQSFVPYLVGGYDEVSDEVAKYLRAGFKMFVLDMPTGERDVHAAGEVFRRAVDKASD